MDNILKDKMGRYITSGLFKETAQGRGEYVIFNLDAAKDLFVNLEDPTGYLFSQEHLADYKHWVMLKESPALSHHILVWEDELEVKLRCKGLQRIIKDSGKEKGYQAAKYLVDAGWNKLPAGRPTKAAIKRESKMRASIYDEFELQAVK